MKKFLTIIGVLIAISFVGSLLNSNDEDVESGVITETTVYFEKPQETTTTKRVKETEYNIWDDDDYNVTKTIITTGTSVKTTEPNNYTQKNTSNKGSTETVVVPKQSETVGNLVWVPTNGGKKYHCKSNCSQMKDPIQVTKEKAEQNGYKPCGRCY